MSAWIAAARAVHFGSTMLLFGGLVFALAIRMPVWRIAVGSGTGRGEQVEFRILRAAAWGLAVSVVSAFAWLVLEAASMSGLPLGEAMSRDNLARVLAKTTFGRVWLLRLGLAIAFAMVLLAMRRPRYRGRTQRLALVALVVAGIYLAALAWSGHAGAAEGPQRYVHLSSDVVHLLAAGAWLGALPGLVLLLGGSPSLDDATQVVRRFSRLGVAIVGALAVTGALNAWFLVGSLPALFGTDYGRLLLAKLSLFAAMVALAAVNRLALTPRLAVQAVTALRSLRRNAALETAAGIAIVIIVGALGITIPASHQLPVLPSEPLEDHRPVPAPERHMH